MWRDDHRWWCWWWWWWFIAVTRSKIYLLFAIIWSVFFCWRLVGVSISRPVQRHRAREREWDAMDTVLDTVVRVSHTLIRWDGSLIVQFLQHNNCNCSLTSEEEEKEAEKEDGNKTAFNRFLLLLFLLHKELNSLLRTAFPVTQSVCLALDNNHHNHMRRAHSTWAKPTMTHFSVYRRKSPFLVLSSVASSSGHI